MLTGGRVEVLAQVDTVVEVAVRFASGETPVDVRFLDVGPSVVVRVADNANRLPVFVGVLPDVGPTVAIDIRSRQPEGRRLERSHRKGDEEHDAANDSDSSSSHSRVWSLTVSACHALFNDPAIFWRTI